MEGQLSLGILDQKGEHAQAGEDDLRVDSFVSHVCTPAGEIGCAEPTFPGEISARRTQAQPMDHLLASHRVQVLIAALGPDAVLLQGSR